MQLARHSDPNAVISPAENGRSNGASAFGSSMEGSIHASASAPRRITGILSWIGPHHGDAVRSEQAEYGAKF
jgi:hypothetical protein